MVESDAIDRWYVLRTRLLIVGFTAQVVARVLPAFSSNGLVPPSDRSPAHTAKPALAADLGDHCVES